MKKTLFTLLLLSCFGIVQPVNADYVPITEAKLEYNQGIDYYNAQQYDRSMASFRRAIELDPNYIDAYYNLGTVLEYLHQDEAALTVFKQIIVRKPDDYEAVYKAANLSKKTGHLDSVKSYLSLIPPQSHIYAKSQELANSLNTDMQTIKAETASAQKNESEKEVATNAMYNNLPSPTGITSDKAGNVYVACFSDNMIYKLTPDGKQIIFIKNPKISGPIALVSDDNENIYVSNYNSNNVIKIAPSGVVSVLIGNIDKPYGMNISNGMLYVSSQGSNSVLRYKL